MIAERFAKKSQLHNIEWVLLILSSTLLGIWAVKETIALRNILLVIGTILSIYYIIQELREGRLEEQLKFWKVLPIGLIICVFIWIVAHYFLFSIDPKTQFEELKSTWLRALFAMIVGLGTGLALGKHPHRLNILWLGIFISFIVLFSQYIPRALAQQKLLVPDYDYYLFHLKINTVMMGAILMAGVDGAVFDYLRCTHYRIRRATVFIIFYWFVVTVMSLWSFVYIIDSRNGIALSTILYFFWFICVTTVLVQGKEKLSFKKLIGFTFILFSLFVVLFFSLMQNKINKGWTTLIDDAMVAVQIDHYPNWKNPVEMGYPKNKIGKTVTTNNYERIAWATAGSRAIIQYPQGVGILSFPFTKHPNAPQDTLHNSSKFRIATHSGWVELGLAFGAPILFFIFSAIAITFANAIRSSHSAKMSVLGLLVSIMFLYTIGEATIDHGLEILFYLLALLPALLLANFQTKKS
jgi:hypothetical protein